MNSQTTTIKFKLFRHKWKIISLTLIGLGAATYFYFTNTPPYQSEAKILIRYVADVEKMQPDQSGTRIISPDIDRVIHSEMEILTSFDLAAEVATNIGPEKILAKLGGGNDPIAAAAVIENGLRVDVGSNSSVVHVFFRHPDPTIPRLVLTELIDNYLEKHALVHSDVGASDDFLNMQITQLRAQVANTDEQMRQIKTNAGIVSVEDSQKFYSSELSSVQHEIFQLEEQLDENQAQAEAQKPNEDQLEQTNLLTDVPLQVISQFRTANAHLLFLQKRESGYINALGYTDQNPLVIETRQEIGEAEQALQDLDKKYPGVAEALSATSDGNTSPAWSSIPTRLRFLHKKMTQIQADAAKLEDINNQISGLERTKQMEEANLEYWQKDLDQKRLDEEMGSSRVANIQRIQNPSPPYRDYRQFNKTIWRMIFGGLAFGLIWAFISECRLYFSVKRAASIKI